MTDENRCLGCIPSRRDPRTLKLRRYYDPAAQAPPPARRWDAPVSVWGTQGNDRYGNCVIVTAAHAIQTWNANESMQPAPIADSAVIELSRRMGALNGYSILDRLRFWRRNTMFSNRLWAYAEFPPDNGPMLRSVVNDFGCADIALSMPAAWQSSKVWGTGSHRSYRAGSWGEHSVPVVGYDQELCYLVTWGYLQPITYAALAEYSGEAYALINPAWMACDATTPSGFDLPAIHAALQDLST